jgi:RimJ/RimL family protein N-acetyltransferase
MRDYPMSVRLRGGRTVTLRPLQADDAERLHRFFAALPEADRLFLRHEVTDRAVTDRWCKNIDYDHVLPILALAGGEVVGDATLHVEHYGWWRRLGEVRMVVAAAYQRAGLGTQLLREVYRHATGRGLRKLQAMVMDSQTGALRALEKLGFVTEALLRNHVTDLRGASHNLHIMTADVEEQWRRMEDMIMDAEVQAPREE